MRRWAGWVVALGVGVAGCAGVRGAAPDAAKESATSVDAAGWLVGRWVDAEGGGEAWTRVGSALLGVGWLRGGDGGWSYEVMRVDAPAGLRFTAWPSGQAAARFPERSRGAGEVEFAAPEHDFPKVVRYRQTSGGLAARIEGDRSADGMDFNYVAAQVANAPDVEEADRGLAAVAAKAWVAERPEDVRAWTMTREVLGSGAAPGGELAYTLGTYVRGDVAGRGDYVLVWRRGATWRVELAVFNPG